MVSLAQSPLLLAERIRGCAQRLAHSARLAIIAADSPEPERGARYLIDTVEDVSAELRFFRAALGVKR